MAAPGKLRELEARYGDLETVIPPKVNQQGQRRTAEELEVSESTINAYLKRHGWRPRIVYEKVGEAEKGGDEAEKETDTQR